MNSITPTSQALLDRYEAVKKNFVGADVPWLAAIRDESAATFRKHGLPTPRTEDWKYTNLRALNKIALDGDAATDVNVADLPERAGSGPRLVFVDGRYRGDLSHSGASTKGVRCSHVADLLESDKDLIESSLAETGDETPLLALNGAFQEDGYALILERTTLVDELVEVLHVNAGSAVNQPRNIIAVGAGARVRLLETHVGTDASTQFFNGATLVTVDEGAKVEQLRHQMQPVSTVHINTIRTHVAAGASYNSFVLAEGGQMSRDEIQVALMGKAASTKLHGVYLGSGSQVLDNTTVIRHQTPGTKSEENYRGALNDQSRGVFQGNILVQKGADGTDGRMSNKTILLSGEAEINSKPQLEIYADDVQCVHGSTAGELEEAALFYLRARGIPEGEAKTILVEGFLAEVMEEFGLGELAGAFRARISSWMEA